MGTARGERSGLRGQAGAYGTAKPAEALGDVDVEASHGAPSGVLPKLFHWLTTSEDTDPARLVRYWCEDFKPRKLKAPLVLGWLGLQLFGLVFQAALLAEVSEHLAAYEATLSTFCGESHLREGVCIGPAWNFSASSTLVFPPTAGDEDGRSDFDFVIPSDQSMRFQVLSVPPTFLVGVEPQSPCEGAAWTATFGCPNCGGAVPRPLSASGKRYKAIHQSRYLGPQISQWTVSMHLRSRYEADCRILVFAVDSRIQHLEDIERQPQCSFADSWQNFAERHNGEHHRVLANTRLAVAAFLALSVMLVMLVMPRFYYYVEGGKILGRVIVLKFVAQDIPQQLCIVAYLYAWYASNGLRCQMCIFHPSHCDDEHPLHWTNFMVAIFTMASACSNQLLLQAKFRKHHSEEDACFVWGARFALFSASILPFSTAIVILSSSLLHLRSVLVYLGFGIPMIVGFATLLCVPLCTCCDEDV